MMNSEKYIHYLPEEITRPDNPVHIALIGCGGTGSQIISGLARMNEVLKALGHKGLQVSAVDNDIVSRANIGRQLFSPVDEGRYKSEVLITRVNNFFGLRWEAHNVRITKDSKISHCPIVITAVDNAATRKEVFENLKLTYHIDTGNTDKTGQVIAGTKERIRQPDMPGTVSKLPAATELYPEMEDNAKQGPSCSLEQALHRQDLFVNQFVATCALQLLWQGFRRGKWEHHGTFINLTNMTVKPLPIDPETWKRMGYIQKEDNDAKEQN